MGVRVLVIRRHTFFLDYDRWRLFFYFHNGSAVGDAYSSPFVLVDHIVIGTDNELGELIWREEISQELNVFLDK